MGTWQRIYACQPLVRALDEAGLGQLAPRWGAGQFVPDGAPLPRRPNLCKGAVAHGHAHTFWPDGRFNSWDPWDWQQQDEGTYRIVNDHTFVIGNPTFHFHVVGGTTLMLEPVIPADCSTKRCRNDAAWSVTVAYPGYAWTRVTYGGPPQ